MLINITYQQYNYEKVSNNKSLFDPFRFDNCIDWTKY